MEGRFTHEIDIVGGRATAVGTERVRGTIRIDVDDEDLQQVIHRLYRATDEAVCRLLCARPESGG